MHLNAVALNAGVNFLPDHLHQSDDLACVSYHIIRSCRRVDANSRNIECRVRTYVMMKTINVNISFEELYTVYLAMNIVFISVSVMITISIVTPSEMFDCDFDNLMIEEFLSFSYLDVALRF